MSASLAWAIFQDDEEHGSFHLEVQPEGPSFHFDGDHTPDLIMREFPSIEGVGSTIMVSLAANENQDVMDRLLDMLAEKYTSMELLGEGIINDSLCVEFVFRNPADRELLIMESEPCQEMVSELGMDDFATYLKMLKGVD